MAEPRIRFRYDNGDTYPAWHEYELAEILTERNEPHLITEDAPQLSFTIEQGVIYPEDKKTNKRDFLMKDKDNKKFLLTEYNDIIYNPANLKFGAIHRNTLGRGVVSPIYAIFYTDQNPAFIEGIVTNPKFIKRSLKYLEGTVIKLMTLKPRDFVKMKVWIPCLEEQKKIADFLSSVDEVIAASELEVANLETQKKAVMKKIFSQEVRFKREDGSGFPEWEENVLSAYAKIIMGQSPEGSSVNEDGDGEYLIQGKADLRGYSVVPDRYTNKPTKVCEPTDIIMTVRAPVGYVTEVGYKACIGRGVCAIRANEKTFERFIRFNLENNEANWRKIEQGSTFTAISSVDVENFMVSIPCLEEQHLIADFLSDFDEAIAAAKKELELWKELKKGLLQQMFV